MEFIDVMGAKIAHNDITLELKLFSTAMGYEQKLSAKKNNQNCTGESTASSIFFIVFAKESLLSSLSYTINSEKPNLFTSSHQNFVELLSLKAIPRGVATMVSGQYSLGDDWIICENSADVDL